MPRTLLFSLAVATTLATGFNAHAQKAKPPIPTDAAGRWKWEQMEQGPFFSSNLKGSVAALKTLTLRVGSEASPAAATQWINRSSLPEDVKTQLLAKAQPLPKNPLPLPIIVPPLQQSVKTQLLKR